MRHRGKNNILATLSDDKVPKIIIDDMTQFSVYRLLYFTQYIYSLVIMLKIN